MNVVLFKRTEKKEPKKCETRELIEYFEGQALLDKYNNCNYSIRIKRKENKKDEKAETKQGNI